MNERQYSSKYLIAMVDVLGFRDLWKMNDENIVKMNTFYQKLINTVGDSITNESVSFILPDGSIRTSHASYIVFSDTILLWQELHPDKAITFDLISVFLRGLISLYATSFEEGIYLRCGIAIGDCVINHSRTGDFRFSPGETTAYRGEAVFLGMPIVHAYELEEAQDWIGLAFDPSFIDFIEEENCKDFGLVQYEIPLKNKIIQAKYTIPWILYTGKKKEEELEVLRKIIEGVQKKKDIAEEECKKIIRKYEYTIEFIKKIKETS